jgi:hypothetical protein
MDADGGMSGRYFIASLPPARYEQGEGVKCRAAKQVRGQTCPGAVTEQVPFAQVFLRTRRTLASLGVTVCFLPSYSPRQSLAALLAAKSIGIRTVMMNESHAGTARAARLGTWIKRRLVSLFDAALAANA